jgi:hypothetical protein
MLIECTRLSQFQDGSWVDIENFGGIVCIEIYEGGQAETRLGP